VSIERGHADFNEQLRVDGFPPISLGRYLTSSDFATDVAENWQLYIMATSWLAHRAVLELARAGDGHDLRAVLAGAGARLPGEQAGRRAARCHRQRTLMR
jgi:hypothetical protein